MNFLPSKHAFDFDLAQAKNNHSGSATALAGKPFWNLSEHSYLFMDAWKKTIFATDDTKYELAGSSKMDTESSMPNKEAADTTSMAKVSLL